LIYNNVSTTEEPRYYYYSKYLENILLWQGEHNTPCFGDEWTNFRRGYLLLVAGKVCFAGGKFLGLLPSLVALRRHNIAEPTVTFWDL
jgi:hypothetical protein